MRLFFEIPPVKGAILYAMSMALGLNKGRTHKYIRRVPKPGGGYRYYYRTSGVTRSVKDDLKPGAKFRLEHNGEAGHFEVTGRDGDRVTLRHDESGGTMTVSASELQDLLHREHADVVQAQRARTAKRLAAARKHGTKKQIARMEAEAKRFGVEAEKPEAKRKPRAEPSAGAPRLTAAERKMADAAAKGAASELTRFGYWTALRLLRPKKAAKAITSFTPHAGADGVAMIYVDPAKATNKRDKRSQARTIDERVLEASRAGFKRIIVRMGDETRMVDPVQAPDKVRDAHRELAEFAAMSPTFFSSGFYPKAYKEKKPTQKAQKRALKFTNEDRGVLGGVMHVADDTVTGGPAAVATDGHRIAIIPTEGGDWDGSLRDKSGHEMVGRFPDYKRAMTDADGKKNKHDTMRADHLRAALSKIAKLKRATGRGAWMHSDVTYEAKDGRAYLRVDGDDARLPTVRIPVGNTTMGNGEHFAVNARYLADAVSGSKGNLMISHPGKGSTDPIHVRREDGEHHMIMPVRLDR